MLTCTQYSSITKKVDLTHTFFDQALMRPVTETSDTHTVSNPAFVGPSVWIYFLSGFTWVRKHISLSKVKLLQLCLCLGMFKKSILNVIHCVH